jgi:hypothetical protein
VLNSNSILILVTAQYFKCHRGNTYLTYIDPLPKTPNRTLKLASITRQRERYRPAKGEIRAF